MEMKSIIRMTNVFTLQSSSQNVTLKDIKKSFPLSSSTDGSSCNEFHFRFLKLLNPENKVWLDLMNDSDILATINGSIFAKVSRISPVSPSTSPINDNRVSPHKTINSNNLLLHRYH